MNDIHTLLHYAKKHPFLWVIGIVVPCLASLASGLLLSYSLSYFTEAINSGEVQFVSLVHAILWFALALLLATVIEDAARFALTVFILHTEGSCQEGIFSSLLSAKYEVLNQIRRGEILSIYDQDTAAAVRLITYDVFGVVYPTIMGIGYLIVVFLNSAVMGAVMLCLSLLVVLLSIYFSKKYVAVEQARILANDQYTMSAEGTIRGRMAIRAMTAQWDVIQRLEQDADRLCRAELKKVRLDILKSATHGTLYQISYAFAAPLACLFSYLGLLPLAGAAMIVKLSRSLIPILENIGESYQRFRVHQVSANRVRSLTALPQDSTGSTPTAGIPGEKAVIAFDEVSMSYGDRKIASGLSFEIPGSGVTCIVGPSGSGKSSVFKALLGLISYEGSVKLLGHEVQELPASFLREAISFVPEHSDLFAGSVGENIRLGNLSATDREIAEVAAKVGLPANLVDKALGPHGEGLSGGQKQCVAIARSLLKDAPIYIWDEPTAALDPAVEPRIMEIAKELSARGKAVVMISHRPSTIVAANHIVNFSANRK